MWKSFFYCLKKFVRECFSGDFHISLVTFFLEKFRFVFGIGLGYFPNIIIDILIKVLYYYIICHTLKQKLIDLRKKKG